MPEKMTLWDRLVYAVIAGVFGALLGWLGWFLYGLGHSMNYSGPGMDPVLRHWLVGSVSAFAALGFVLGSTAADLVGDALSAILHFEVNDNQPQRMTAFFALIFLAIVIATIWFTAP
ncbi:hypothetical protein [Ottowia testudinis]|uniref:Uncharacterized protein n=1 Tax=Ottowia testudinis TaxID=2816950 RepID=A0A975CFW7_9BURK|nr:hypothetical protein [Ottowia testudinis]QTD44814.1 hypothetical protein J1M35_17360 [Ottowia testudinis]